MIGKEIGNGRSFVGLVNYLENGKRGEKKDRVLWFESENLDGASMKEAAMIMRDAANENSRVSAPVYHFSINWHPEESDRVDQALAMDVTRSAMADLGLEDHQSLIVAHKDTKHFHVHVVANRIHPETGRAWTGSYSKMKLEQALARLSLEHGFEIVPGHHNALDLGIEPPAAENTQSTGAIRYEDRTESPSFDTTVRVELPEVFEKAETWQDLQTSLQERGYGLEAKGRGLVVTGQDGEYAKASAIGREFSRASLEQRFGAPFPVPEGKGAPTVEKPAPGPGLPNEQKTLTKYLKEAESWREYAEIAESFGYRAKAKGRGLVLEKAGDQVKSSELDRSLGRGRLEERFGQTFPDFEATDDRAIAQRELDQARGIEKAMTALENYERAEEYAIDLFIARQEVLARTDQSFEMVQRAKETRQEIERIAGDVYQRPDAAMREFDAKFRQLGTQKTVELLSEKPQAFGRTKGRGVLGFGGDEFKRGMAGLRHAGRQYIEARSALAENRQVIDADLKERFDKPTLAALEKAQKALKEMDRGRLVRDVLTAAEAVKTNELKDLPFRTRLRASVVFDKIGDLRGEEQDRKKARGDGIKVGKEFRRWPSMPLGATPSEARAFEATERYAKARHVLRNAAPWRAAQTRVSREMVSELREAAQGLVNEGRAAGRYHSRFGVDKRTLQADTFAGVPQAAARRNEQMSSFLKAKSPKIRLRFTTILRMLGVPIPRIPIPRPPRMSVKSRGRSMIREMNR